MYDRAILHMDLDSFFVSVEVLRNSALKGLPLLIGGSGDRGVVASCSYEARKFGVHSAMPMKMARRLCPDAVILRGDMDAYSEYSRQVTELIAEDAPCMEKASIDEFYLDLSGMDRYFGCYQWSLDLRQKIIKDIGLPISLALSVNKTVSKIGTNEAKPNGTKEVIRGTEKDFLAPLSTAKMPGIGEATYKKLSFMGVRTLKVLSEIPPRLLEREFGKWGKVMWERANAFDPTPVTPYSEAKSISHEQTFGQDTLDLRKIKNIMLAMVDKLGFDLRQSQKLCSIVTVKIRYADFNTYTRQIRIAYTANDKILLRHVYDLFEKLYERRQMIRLIGVKFSGLVHGHYQINLFDDTEQDMNLLNELDHIRKRWGAQAIGKAVTVDQPRVERQTALDSELHLAKSDNRVMPDKRDDKRKMLGSKPIDPKSEMERWARMTRRWH